MKRKISGLQMVAATAASVALWVLPIISASAAGLALSYRAPAGVPAWSEGSVLPLTNGDGYLLSTSGPPPTNTVGGVGSQALAHLDTVGNPDWGLWTVEGAMGSTTLTASPTPGPDHADSAPVVLTCYRRAVPERVVPTWVTCPGERERFYRATSTR